MRTIWSCINVYDCNWFFWLFQIVVMVWFLWLWQSMHVFHLNWYTLTIIEIATFFFFFQIFHHHSNAFASTHYPHNFFIIRFFPVVVIFLSSLSLTTVRSSFVCMPILQFQIQNNVSNVHSPGNTIKTFVYFFFLLLFVFWVCAYVFAFVCIEEKKYVSACTLCSYCIEFLLFFFR